GNTAFLKGGTTGDVRLVRCPMPCKQPVCSSGGGRGSYGPGRSASSSAAAHCSPRGAATTTGEPPGGVLELDETIEDGLRREAREETGLEVEPIALTGVYKNMTRGIVAPVFRWKITGGVLP